MKQLYIVIRADLKPGLLAAQACHALQAMNDQHPDLIAEWEGNLVLLSVASVLELSELACSLQRARLPLAMFTEPDLGGELTAVAISGAASRRLSHLPLALKIRSSPEKATG